MAGQDDSGFPSATSSWLAALGYPFKWAKTHGGFRVESPFWLEGGDRLQKPEPLLEGAAPLSFFTDAKAEAGRAWIGGFLELVDGCQGPWFSLEVKGVGPRGPSLRATPTRSLPR